MSDDMSISAVRIRIAACAFPAREEMYFSRDGVFHRNVLIPPQLPTVDDALALLAAFDEQRAEMATLRTERDRLARILAVERGDESQAPEGWWVSRAGLWAHGPKPGPVDAEIQHAWIGRWAWSVWLSGFPQPMVGLSVTAIEAMEAADKARGVRHD